jgi:hypothetical protein
MTDDEFDENYARIIEAYKTATNEANGAFFLIRPTSPEWPGHPVTNEPAFETEWRTRCDANTNPTDTFVILPYPA